jgi:hypothetical protein
LDKDYKYYGLKGIECLITLKEVRFLWNRDGAGKMKQPSIDRINNAGNYELGNCRFIELRDNQKRPKIYGRPVESIDIKTGEVKKYLSSNQAKVIDGYSSGDIRLVLSGKRKQHRGKYWRLTSARAIIGKGREG